MHVTVKNFLGVKNVEVPLGHHPVLVTGPNAAGKSSIATAVGAILARNFDPLSIGAKKRAYVHDEAEDGESHVLLVGEGGTEYRRWLMSEKGIRVMPGGPENVTKHVLGLTDFIGMPSSHRIQSWEECFLPAPKELVELVGTALREQIASTAVVDEVLSMLRTRKWDECEAVFKHKGREAKAEWSRITGEAYGPKKADRWAPKEGWRSDLDTMTPVEASTQVEEAAEALRLVQTQGAVREADAERARSAAAEVPSAEKDVARLTAIRDEARSVRDSAAREHQELVTDGRRYRDEVDRHRRAQPIREDTTPCPACGEALVVGPGTALTRAQDEGAFNAHHGAWQVGLDRMEAELARKRQVSVRVREEKLVPAESALRTAAGNLEEAVSRLGAAKRIAALVEGRRVATDDDQRKEAQAEQAVDDRKREADLVRRKVAANNAHLNAVNYSTIAYALGPRGIRSRAMRERLEALVAALRDFESVSSWPPVELDATYMVSVGGRPGVLASQSEKWRAQFLIQCAIARVLGEPFVIADGADVLDATGRQEFNALVEHLAGTGIFTLAFATGSLFDTPPTTWRTVEIVSGVAAGGPSQS